MVRATPKGGHWLEGHMVDTDMETIESVLEWSPASNQELMMLALEESKGRDRVAVYRLFARLKK